MKRLHIHVSVPDLPQSISFYETLFGAPASVVKSDYAKWMLNDPMVNFAISQRGRAAGLDHVGIQVDSRSELDELAGRLKAAGANTFDQEAASCCYAKSDKSWVADPAGLRWETFFSFGAETQYGEDTATEHAAEPVANTPCGCPGTAKAIAKTPEPVAAPCCGVAA